MKKISRILFIIVTCFLAWNDSAHSAAVLERLTADDEQTSMLLFFRFSTLPRHQVTTNGRKVELILTDTILGNHFEYPPANEHLIKIVSKKEESDTILSFYFRYPPQKTVVNVREETASFMLDILLGNPLSKKYPDLSSRLQGVTLLNRKEIDYTNPLQVSPYVGNWISFFKEHENEIVIQPLPRYSLPPFPLASHVHQGIESLLTEKTKQEIFDEQWGQVAELIRSLLDKEQQSATREALLLAYADAMARSPRKEEAFSLLQHIVLNNPDPEQVLLARYLLLYLQATAGDPYYAHLELQAIDKETGGKPAFPAYFTIFLAETAMFTGRLDEARQILARDDIAYTGQANTLRLLRQADLRYLKNDKIQAFVSYLQIKKTSDIIRSKPCSLAYFSDLLYEYNRKESAAEHYDRLSELLIDSTQQDLALYRLAASRLASGLQSQRVTPLLSQIQDAYPGSAGAYLAALKEIDIGFLNGSLQGVQAAQAYGRLAAAANRSFIREEAAFKQALVFAMMKEFEQCIDTCMKILREFRTGKLRTETSALVIENLPQVIKNLIDEGQHVRALALSQKNRLYFARGWIDHSLLYEIAKLYVELGVYDRAIQTYQYLFEISGGEEREKIYLPLIEMLFENREFTALADYADRFLFRYPDRPDTAAIFFYRLQALKQEGQLKQAVQLLGIENRPKSAEIDNIAASIYFDLSQYEKVIASLSDSAENFATNTDERFFQLAESYFQTRQYDEAAPLFSQIATNDEKHRDQAIYRQAQIGQEQGARERALNLFRELAEKGTDPLWIKMAQEQVKIMGLQENQE